MRSSEGRLAVGPGESWTSVEALIDLRWRKAAWRHSTRVSGVEQIYTCPQVIGPVTVIVGAVSEDDGKAAVGTGQMSGRPLSSPLPCLPFLPLTSGGCQRHHDQDGGWDFKCIVDLIMEICGISSCMPQSPEATQIQMSTCVKTTIYVHLTGAKRLQLGLG